MKSIKFTLETITPLFLAGADGQTPELRPPSIKGMMRFWWRAVKGLSDIRKLQEEEAKIFGIQEKKAPFSIKIEDSGLISGPHRPLPHSSNPRKQFSFQGFDANQTFSVTLSCKDKGKINDYKNTFELSLLLGGLGKRTRRGFGSLRIIDWDFKSEDEIRNTILGLMNSINNDFQINGSIIERINKSRSNYPVITEVYFGSVSKNSDALLKNIGQASHNHCNPSLGNGNPQMSSPVIARIQRINGGYLPIVTKLSSHFPNGYPYYNLRKQNNFIAEVLS